MDEPAEPVKYVVTFPTLIRETSAFNFNMILFANENYTLPVSFKALLTTGYGSEKQTLAEQTFTQSKLGLQRHQFTVSSFYCYWTRL